MTATFLGFDKQAGINGSKSATESTREYSGRVNVRCTAPPTTSGEWASIYAALSGAGIAIGAACPVDNGAICVNIRPQSQPAKDLSSAGGARRWDVAVDVKWTSNPAAVPQSQDDPSLRPPTVSFTTSKWSSPALEDVIDHSPIANSAGDPIVRERRRARMVIKFGKLFKNYSIGYAREAPDGFVLSRNKKPWFPIPKDYAGVLYGDGPGGAVNLALFGVAPGKAMLEDLTVVPVYENGIQYVKVDAEIRIDDDRFYDEILDQGFTYLDPASRRQRFRDRNGPWSTTPQNLDGHGHPLADGARPVPLDFQYYPLLDWDDLALS